MKLFDYKFTDRKHPAVGIMSVVLGLIGIISESISLFIPYLAKREPERYAFIMALSFLYAIVGIVLGIIGRFKKGAFPFFPSVGLVINTVTIILGVIIIVIGAA